MGIYGEHVLPRIINVACGMALGDPLQKRLFGGCHLTRQITDLVEGAGFTIQEVEVFYEEGAPKVMGAHSLGVAAA